MGTSFVTTTTHPRETSILASDAGVGELYLFGTGHLLRRGGPSNSADARCVGGDSRRTGLRPYARFVDLFAFALVAIVVGAFAALIAWLRSGSGELHPPGEAGDADKWPRIDSGG